MVIVVANRIPVAKGWEEAFERRWLNRKWSIATLPGFLGTEVLRPMKGDVYVVQTHWRSMKDFERWTKSAAFGEAHADRRRGKRLQARTRSRSMRSLRASAPLADAVRGRSHELEAMRRGRRDRRVAHKYG